MSTDSQSQYKMILQTYAQRKSLGLPAYSNKREGLPHNLRFIAAVTVGGESFESPTFCKNLKEAEHLAAQVALLSLSLDVSQEASFFSILFYFVLDLFVILSLVPRYLLTLCIYHIVTSVIIENLTTLSVAKCHLEPNLTFSDKTLTIV